MITLEDVAKAEEQKITKIFAVFEDPINRYTAVQQDLETVKWALETEKEKGNENPKWAERRFLTRDEAIAYIDELTKPEEEQPKEEESENE